ncbi:MAG: RNA-directed DNA polymerase [Lachnospiraceae bacterium]|nr:RNA-directed DNA polymerase [Lachnospiraceae bacterium]
MITITFEELFTYKNIYRAHLKGRKCKRRKRPLVRFEMATISHISDIYERLHAGKFKVGRYSKFTVEVPKKREIQTQPYENRVVQHVLCDNILAPYFTQRAILDNAACQKGKGTHFALERFEKSLQAYVTNHGVTGYFLECDILKYFPSIPHKRLKQIICPHIADERIRQMIEDIIDSYHTKPTFLDRYEIPYLHNETEETGRGVPIGNQTSQIFGMFYLNTVDRLVKERLRIKVYSRFMDDWVLVHEDINYINYAFEAIKKAVRYLGLQLNTKTQIFPLKNGVTFLGYRFIINPEGTVVKTKDTTRTVKKGREVVRTVKKTTKKRIRQRAALLKKAYLDGIIPIERVNASLAAFHGHLKHGKNVQFEEELHGKLTFETEEETE